MTIIRFIRSAFSKLRINATKATGLQNAHLPCDREMSRLGICKADYETIHMN